METYLTYLEQVLGLKSVLLPYSLFAAEELSPAEELSLPEDHIQVLFLAEKSWSPQAFGLFQKMRDAMKLEEKSTRLIFSNQMPESQWQILALSADRVVCFSPTLFESLDLDSENKFLTHDPEVLLQKPELKKPAWEDLKGVMKSLGLL